jgi:hypothetical protein
MKKTKAHPLADAQAARLDILYGGTESQIIGETMKIATDAIRTLELEEHILVLNTLMNKRAFEPLFFSHMDKRDSLRGGSFYGSKLIQKLDFFEHLIIDVKVRMVILNNFDLAAFNSRHRMQLLEFIKWMRDDQNIHVIICMNNEPKSWGSHGSLRIMASSIMAIGGHVEADSQEPLGSSTAKMDRSGWPYKREPFVPTMEKTPMTTVAARQEDEQTREMLCTDEERDLAEYKVRECNIPPEYSPFSSAAHPA